MTMRALIEKKIAPTDDYEQPGPPTWVIVGVDVPCYAWCDSRSTLVGDKLTVTVGALGMIVPLETDVGDEYRVREVTDRRGCRLFDVMYVDGVSPRKDHLGVRLRDYA